MSLAGTIVNGAIQLDGNPSLPEGMRVRVELTTEDESADLCGPEDAETYQQHLTVLRESIDEARTGQTRPAREVMKELAIKYGLTMQSEK